MMNMAVLQWLVLCLLLSAGPRIAAARSLLELMPAELFSAGALLQAEQCTCTCPSPTVAPAPAPQAYRTAPAPAPQSANAAAPAPAPAMGSPVVPAPAPQPESTTAPTPAPEAGSPAVQAPGPEAGNSTVPAPAPEIGSPVVSAPAPENGSSTSETPIPSITVSSPASLDAAPYCTANIQPGVTWANGDGTYSGIMNVLLVNHRTSDIPTGWTFSIQNPNYLGLFGAWNWVYNGMDSTGTATGSAHESWETIRANAQNQVNVGAIFQGRSPQNFYPRAITVNGQPCYIQQLR